MAAEGTVSAGTGNGNSLISGFVDWWLNELAALVPRSLREGRARRRRSIVVESDGDQIRIIAANKAGKVKADESFEDSEAGLAQARRFLRRAVRRGAGKADVGVRFPRSACFVRTFQIAAAAIADLPAIAAAELRQKTPFEPGDIRMDYVVSDDRDDNDRVAVRQYFVKASLFDEALETARALGANPTFADVASPSGVGGSGVNFMRVAGDARKNRWAWLLIKLLVVIVVCLAGLTVYLAFQREDAALARLNARIELTKAVALDVRQTIEDTSATANHWTSLKVRKASTLPLVQLWDEVTKSLPDNVWITELQLRGERVEVTGYAHSAATLIGILERSPYFKSARFGSPVNVDPQLNKERFNIGFELESMLSGSEHGDK